MISQYNFSKVRPITTKKFLNYCTMFSAHADLPMALT